MRIHIVAMAIGTLATGTGVARAQSPIKSAAERRADSLLLAGDFAAALHDYQQLTTADSGNLRAWYGAAMAAYNGHDDANAARLFERAAADGKNSVAMYNAGAMHARLGQRDEAFLWLDKAITARFPQPGLFASDSDLVSLHADARFPALLQHAQTLLNAPPCMADSNARRLDFWVGDWRVTPANSDVTVGHSVVQRVSNGCALLENWTDNRGNEGKSLNTYNPATSEWEQFWVGPGGGPTSYVTDYHDSHWDGPTLVYLAHGWSPQGAFLQRLSFTPIDSNTVRQLGESSTDAGKTWQTGYDFRYHRNP